jgi:hypothetical protein
MRVIRSTDLIGRQFPFKIKGLLLRPQQVRMTCDHESGTSTASTNTALENSKKGGEDEQRQYAVGDLASETIRTVESIVLYAFHQAPAYLQDNQFILSGYRGELNSVERCIQSLWYLHNETGILRAVSR